MLEQRLQDNLKRAQETGKIGLLIWHSWTMWDDLSSEMKKGNEMYDRALSNVSKGEEDVSFAEWDSTKTPVFIAVPVQKLIDSEEYFKHIVKVCEKGHYAGPITVIPVRNFKC